MNSSISAITALATLLFFVQVPCRADFKETIAIEVKLPADARVEIDGRPTQSAGTRRRYLTPPLPVGKEYRYTLKVTSAGKTVIKEIRIRHGADNTFDLRPDFQAAVTKTPVSGKNVGKCLTVEGILLHPAGKTWQRVRPGDSLPDGGRLIALFEAKLLSGNQAVEVRLFGDIGVHGHLPIMEAATTLRNNPSVDLDLALERGILVLVNKREKGPARVSLRIRDQVLDVVLQEPGTRLGMEIYGRHAPGMIHIKKDDPTTFLIFLAVKGRAILSTAKKSITLFAPPGPALLRWDSIDRTPEVEYLKELPGGMKRAALEEKEYRKMCAAAQRWQDQDLVQSLARTVQSPEPIDRLVAVTGQGATDALQQLLEALGDPKHADVRRQAILVLRHWLGRQPGQAGKLYEMLRQAKKWTDPQARSLIQLLFGFDEPQRKEPETYDLLIDDLQHRRLLVRELAHWHLVRLAPAGKDIPYDAAGPPAQRQQAQARWRQLIPPGQLPPRPKSPPAKK